MKICQVNSSDLGGGAEKISLSLHNFYLNHSQDAWLFVNKQLSKYSQIRELPIPPAIHDIFNVIKYHDGNVYKILNQLNYSIKNRINKEKGVEYFQLPNASAIADLLLNNSDIIHLHNLHGRYFDIKILPKLAASKPVFITMHDEWLYTGHCASSLDCEKWKSGCGGCPYLNTYPEIKKDRTIENLQRKKGIFFNRGFYIATPSKWLYDRVNSTFLQHQEIRIINNGIDLEIYSPGDKLKERLALNLDPDTFVFLYIANRGTNNLFRDYTTVVDSVKIARARNVKNKFLLLIVGGEDYFEGLEDEIPIVRIPYIVDERQMAAYYRSADILLYATNADNFPTVIIEAMACGLPVIATAVGGIREQVQEGQSGFMVPKGDATEMAARISLLLNNLDLPSKMSEFSAKYAKEYFGVEQMSEKYIEWYREIVISQSESTRK